MIHWLLGAGYKGHTTHDSRHTGRKEEEKGRLRDEETARPADSKTLHREDRVFR